MTNAIKRVHRVLAKAVSTSPESSEQAYLVWPEVLGLNSNTLMGATEKDSLALRYILALRAQIDLAEAEVQAFPEHLKRMQKPLKNARTITSTLALSQTWKSIVHQLTPQHMAVWDMAGISLPDTEKDGDDALADVRAAIDELEIAAKEAAISEDLRAVLLAQVAALRGALRMYAISGAQAIEEQLERSIGAVVVQQNIEAASDDESGTASEPTTSRIGAALVRILRGCRKLKPAAEFARLGVEVIKLAFVLGGAGSGLDVQHHGGWLHIEGSATEPRENTHPAPKPEPEGESGLERPSLSSPPLLQA